MMKIAEPLSDAFAFSTNSASNYADIGKSPSIPPYIEYKVTGKLLDGYRIVEKYFKLVNLAFSNKIGNVVKYFKSDNLAFSNKIGNVDQIPTFDSQFDIKVCSLFIILKNGKVFNKKHYKLFDTINEQLAAVQCKLSFVTEDNSGTFANYAVLKDTTIMLDGEKNKESAALANVELAQYLDDTMYSAKLV